MRNKELSVPLKALEECDFTLKDFDVTREGLFTTFKLKVQPKLSFMFETSETDFTMFNYIYASYNPSFTRKWGTSKAEPLETAIVGFKKWLNADIKEYLEELKRPDPLEEARKTIAFENINDTDTSKFTNEESASLIKSIQEFEKQVFEKFEVSKETSTSIKKELRYLQDQVKELNKRDFKSVAQKVIYDIGISVTANVAVEAGRALVLTSIIEILPTFWEIVKLVFKSISLLN